MGPCVLPTTATDVASALSRTRGATRGPVPQFDLSVPEGTSLGSKGIRTACCLPGHLGAVPPSAASLSWSHQRLEEHRSRLRGMQFRARRLLAQSGSGDTGPEWALVHVLRAHPQLLKLIAAEQSRAAPARGSADAQLRRLGRADCEVREVRLSLLVRRAGDVRRSAPAAHALNSVPLERLMADTDAPEQVAPPPPRPAPRARLPAADDRRDEPRARGEEVREAVTQNVRRFFSVR